MKNFFASTVSKALKIQALIEKEHKNRVQDPLRLTRLKKLRLRLLDRLHRLSRRGPVTIPKQLLSKLS